MLLTILAIFIILIGGVFVVSAVIMGSNIKRTRTPRAKQLLIRRCRNTAILSVVAFVTAIVLLVVNFLPGQIQGRLAGDAAYDLTDTYATVLSGGGEEKAYLYLPSSVYADDECISLQNDRGEWFVYEATENSEGETSYRWINRGKNTAHYQTLSLGEQTVMTLQLGLDGRLYADGTFPFMMYDTDSKIYSGQLAKNVGSFFCNGNTLFYVTEGQDLYALGLNEYGQMGDSSSKNKTAATYIRSDIVSVSASETHAMMVDIFGNLYATGDNSDSQLGDGTMANVSAPIKIMGGVREAAVGNFFSVILAQNGDVYTCGRNTLGQCGNGSKNGTATPTKIAGGAIKIVASDKSAAYLTEEGKVYAWGANDKHCLSLDATAYFNTPTLIAENVYDIAMNVDGLVILDRERNIRVTGALRDDTAKLTEEILDIKAKVPESYLSPVEREEKPDINELGKDE
ncbi:MAG: hypothetical protein IKY33_01985 [Clostridia bacterium]|nr:hypothetical protein [Clostridia bacterium]